MNATEGTRGARAGVSGTHAVSGLDAPYQAGVYSDFLRQSEAAAAKYGPRTVDILVQLGRRRMLAGRERMIVDVALAIAWSSSR